MSKVELIMPKMGESVSEATIISWAKEVGEIVELDETIIEIATDKVDSEVPSTHEGKLVEKLFQENDIVQVGKAFAIIETKDDEISATIENEKNEVESITNEKNDDNLLENEENSTSSTNPLQDLEENNVSNSGKRFYSPLVRSIALKEGIDMNELRGIPGTGKNRRVTKSDMISYIQTRGDSKSTKTIYKKQQIENSTQSISNITSNKDAEIIEMDRMRRLISTHMTMSKQTSAHITSFVEADMTNIVRWRNKVKSEFQAREGQNITFTPIIIESMVKAVKDFPMINVSVEGTNIHIYKNVNVGMAAALPDGNLIVPVIKECQNKSLVGITKSVNDLATRARSGKLNPDDIQGGTITMTNVGTFGNLMGTPIINQPQVAIMACGVIKKKPVVLETKVGDVIAIRNMMYLSLSYDHRVVDGSLGGQFVRRVADYLEKFDINSVI